MITNSMTDLSISHRYVLETIKSLSYKWKECIAENKTIADRVGLSISRVSHIISDLVDKGLLIRRLDFHPNSKRVALRHLIVVQDRDARGIAINSKEQNKGLKDIINSPTNGQTFRSAIYIGLPMGILMAKILKYGEDYVASKIQLLLHSKSVKKVVNWFIAACEKNYEPSKAMTPKVLTKPVPSINIMDSIPSKIEITPDNPFLKLIPASKQKAILSSLAKPVF